MKNMKSPLRLSTIFGGGPWFREHRRAAALVAVGLYMAVFALTLFAPSANDDIAVLYALPVALVAVTFGRRGGVFGAVAGIGLFALALPFADSGMSVVGWATRAGALLLLGFLLGDATDRVVSSEEHARQEELARERLEEERWRHREALELHDTVVQGIAAGIWMLDVGRSEQALDALTSTMGVAQQLVSDLLGPWPIEPGELRRGVPRAIAPAKESQAV